MTSKQWQAEANKLLVGKTIKKVYLLDAEESEQMGFEFSRPFILEFTDGDAMYAQSDDEGNDVGTLVIARLKDETAILPRIPIDHK